MVTNNLPRKSIWVHDERQADGSRKQKMKQRIKWLDNLRAIAIFFVVLGHTVGLPAHVEKLIFSFHMPIFFWISGLFARESIRDETLGGFISKRWRKRLIPYLSFSVISYVAWFCLFRHFGSQAEMNISPIRPLIGFFYGNGINDWLVTNTVLWFFLCLFVTEIFFYFVIKVPSRLWMVLLAGFSIVGYLDVYYNPPDGFRLPWNTDIAFTTVVFYGAGYLSKGYVLGNNKSTPWRWVVMVLSLVLYATFSLLNRKVALVAGVYGNYFYFYAAAMAGICFWMEFAYMLPTSRFFSKIGRNTLTIFSLHLLVFPFITAVLVYGLKMPSQLKFESASLSLAYAVISILVLLPISDLINRYAPFILGESRKPASRVTL